MLGCLKELISFPLRHRRLTLLLAFCACGAAIGGVNVWAWRQYVAAKQALRQDKIEKARAHLTNCLRIWRRSSEAHLLLARIERTSGHYREARQQLSECVRLQGGSSEASQLEKTLLYAQDGGLAEVEAELWKRVDEGHPESTPILETLARLYLHEFRTKAALAALNRWLEREPEAVRAWHWRGWLYEHLEQFDLALADYRKAVELDPGRDSARLRLARLLVERHAATEALPHLLELQQRRPDDPDVQVFLAQCYQLQNEEEQAVRLLDQVLAAHPDHVDALSLRGQLAWLQGHPDEAEAWLRRALAHSPSDLRALYTLSQSLEQQGKEKEAALMLARHKTVEADVRRRKELLHSQAQLPHGDADLLAELGAISLRLGDETAGVQWLHRALQADANNRLAHKELVHYYQSKGDTQNAREHARWQDGREPSSALPANFKN